MTYIYQRPISHLRHLRHYLRHLRRHLYYLIAFASTSASTSQLSLPFYPSLYPHPMHLGMSHSTLERVCRMSP
ncbi:uncharacterized protein K441DRAFT_666396 [Cenococcum geophilum 1.58]|uniref:uncharacterized protein n=1 Tax=Cenococcum geophilum 1.58 TaxID=794803 RepID=UPI00358DF73C|nr:hypothetical protein K441DRAFT_666396 [Cenococcum geophilum 1.58]